MKKLMIAAAIVCAAAFAQATTVKWGSDGVQITGNFDEGTGDYANNFAIYLFDADTFTQSGLQGQFAKGDFTSLSSALDNKVTDDAGAFSTFAVDLGTDKDFNGILAIFDASAAADAKYAFVSSAYFEKDNSAHTINMAYDYETYVNALDYSSKTGWTKIDTVPEPTSGLLLLLGVAGLALRRRRA